MAIKAAEGTSDLRGEEARRWEYIKAQAYELFSRFGYEPIETPLFEQTDLFVRGIGEATDVVSKEMFHVVSGGNLEKIKAGERIRSKSQLALRPEGTASVVRSALEHALVGQGSAPVKLMYAGPMFRAERPQKGRYRQFRQIGVECLGVDSPSLDAEAIIMLMKFYEQIGIPSQEMRLLINSMGCPKCRPAYRSLVAAYLENHHDELCDDCKTRAATNPLRAFDCKQEACKKLMCNALRITDHLCEECASHYAQVKELLQASGIDYIEDAHLVRGLDYYLRTVFEVQIDNGMGSQNALGGGGRYDKLASEIAGKDLDVPGLGFALGYERCMLALEALGKLPVIEAQSGIFLAHTSEEEQALAFELALSLRMQGLTVHIDHQGKSLKSQLKLANKLGVSEVWFLSNKDYNQGFVSIRLMDEHCDARLGVEDLMRYLRAETSQPLYLSYNKELQQEEE